MAVILGLAAALAYGAADFTGGLVSRRAHPFAVVVLSQIFGLALLAAVFPFFDGVLSGSALWWGAAAGVGGGLGVALLYRGLSIGRMSVVAPITAVEAAIVPLLFSIARGESPGAIASVGVVISLGAVVLISYSPATQEAVGAGGRLPAGLIEAVGAGLGFGAFFLFLDRAPDASGLWPLIGTKLSSIVLVAGLAVLARTRLRAARDTWTPIVLAGALDVAANIFYLLAARRGLLAIVAVLTSMYPGATVLLARFILKERTSRLQNVGLILALAGVALIASG